MALSMEDLEFAFKLGQDNMIEKIKKIINLDNDDNILECDVCYEMSDNYIITGNTPNVICSNCNTEERELEELLPFEPDGHHSADAYKEMALEEQLEEIYETVVGDSGRDRFSHGELIQVLKDLYDDSKVLQNIDNYRSK